MVQNMILNLFNFYLLNGWYDNIFPKKNTIKELFSGLNVFSCCQQTKWTKKQSYSFFFFVRSFSFRFDFLIFVRFLSRSSAVMTTSSFWTSSSMVGKTEFGTLRQKTATKKATMTAENWMTLQKKYLL